MKIIEIDLDAFDYHVIETQFRSVLLKYVLVFVKKTMYC